MREGVRRWHVVLDGERERFIVGRAGVDCQSKLLLSCTVYEPYAVQQRRRRCGPAFSTCVIRIALPCCQVQVRSLRFKVCIVWRRGVYGERDPAGGEHAQGQDGDSGQATSTRVVTGRGSRGRHGRCTRWRLFKAV